MALGDTNIIGDVTDLLAATLLTGLDVTMDSPASLKDTSTSSYKKINLYLYQVLEDPFLKNEPWRATGPGTRQYPSLGLDLYYLLTPYASDAKSAHQVLGHVMQIFHDRSLLPASDLPLSLRATVDQLSLTLLPMKLEELTRIWNALQSPYRLSVCYQVRVVFIESTREESVQRVAQKVDVYIQR